ncbi:MAG TPA: H(+)/Cl(-) exchange transporter ClcA [Bryobacteraceae bacterium]|nr:H(+)/Cl(-) exchange transporter ClcA [Bryobacteraceae bacterium]
MADSRENRSGLLRLAVLSCLSGAATGFVVAFFRIALRHADDWRDLAVQRAHDWPVPGLLLSIALVAGLAALATWLVERFSPYAAGSGIPHVEAVAKKELPPAPFSLVPVKFLGGWLAIGGGLALGREGPSVQIGAGLGSYTGETCRLSESDCIALLAAGAGAGLATAFNAPIAGAVFVLEELIRCFDTKIAIAALGASCAAIAIARLLLGNAPDFTVPALPYSSFQSGFFFLALGAVAGLAGVVYNTAILKCLSLASRIPWRPELRAAAIGGLVGALAWLAPGWVGGGDPITQRTLAGVEPIVWLPLLFAVRFLLGPVSYAAGTPGGLFAPMLVLGAQLGWLFAVLCHLILPHFVAPPAAFAVVGMAAFFTAVVRAPVTGIVLVTELTASFTQLIPMLWASFAAMVIPTILRNTPIYDSLSEPKYLRQRGQPASARRENTD